MTSDEFLVWATGVDGEKVELSNGEVIAMAGGSKRHATVKRRVDEALRRGLSASGSGCASFIDDIAVVVDDGTVCFPDVVVDCAGNDDLDSNVASDPVIVVEVLSPSTASHDRGGKFADYFSVPGICHYLIVDAVRQRVTHHARDGECIVSRILFEGTISLDPLGVTINIADFWPRENLV